MNSCELNIFETHTEAMGIEPPINDFLVVSMLRGRKVLSFGDSPSVEFLPGESAFISPRAKIIIDFPDSSEFNPTQCLALAFDSHKVVEVLNTLNEKYPKEGGDGIWQLGADNFMFKNDEHIAGLIAKIIQICQSDDILKDALADLSIQELILKIIQVQNLEAIASFGNIKLSPKLLQAIEFIKENLSIKLDSKLISKKVGLSPSTMYRLFKSELGISPFEFIIIERIKLAKQYLADKNNFIKNVSYDVGFEDSNYFIRVFKHYEGLTPRQYQQKVNVV